MIKQEIALKFKPVRYPKWFRGPFSNNGWKRYSFEVFDDGAEPVGRLDVMMSQHRKHATSVQFYLFDSDDTNRVKFFNAPVLHPWDSQEELFEKAKRYALRCFEKKEKEKSVPVEKTPYSK